MDLGFVVHMCYRIGSRCHDMLGARVKSKSTGTTYGSVPEPGYRPTIRNGTPTGIHFFAWNPVFRGRVVSKESVRGQYLPVDVSDVHR